MENVWTTKLAVDNFTIVGVKSDSLFNRIFPVVQFYQLEIVCRAAKRNADLLKRANGLEQNTLNLRGIYLIPV